LALARRVRCSSRSASISNEKNGALSRSFDHSPEPWARSCQRAGPFLARLKTPAGFDVPNSPGPGNDSGSQRTPGLSNNSTPH
jgi:hypothetical protein